MSDEELRNLYAAFIMHALIGRGRPSWSHETVDNAFKTADVMVNKAKEYRRNSDGTRSE